MRYLFFILFAGLMVSCEQQASNQGDALFQSGNYEEAVRAYTNYLALYPTDVKSLYNRGRAYEEMDLFELSIKDFQLVLEEDSKNLQANLSVGSYFYRKQDYDNAKYYFDIAVKNHESSAQAHFLQARAFHKVGRKNEAMSGYNKAISLNPDLGEAYLYRGALRTFMKQHSKACEDYRQAKALNVEEADIQISSFCN